MKKITLIGLVLSICATLYAQVQEVDNTNIYLTGYILPVKGDVIGTIKSCDQAILNR